MYNVRLGTGRKRDVYQSKSFAIAQHLGILNLKNRTTGNQKNLITENNMWDGNFFHFPMRWADMSKRTKVMVAQMIHEGTWDAYTYKDGILTYDIKKDSRYYDADGKIKGDKEKALLDFHMQNMQKDNLVDADGNALRAYNFQGSRRIQGVGSKFIMGTYDMKNRVALDDSYWGDFFLQFKNWLSDIITLHFGKKRYYAQGAKEVVYQDPVTKEYYTKMEMPFLEGQFRSCLSLMMNTMGLHDSNVRFKTDTGEITMGSILSGTIEGTKNVIKNIATIKRSGTTAWNQLTSEQKFGVRRQVLELAVFTACIMLYGGLFGDDDKKKGLFAETRLLSH